MLGKQWLNLHVEGSFIDRNRHRQQKMRGMITWRFKLVMECLPLIMQISLLLLGYALARYLQTISRTVSSVITGFTSAGVIVYLLIVAAGTLSRTCPFQTPISIAIRAILEFYRKDIENASGTVKRFFGFEKSSVIITHRQQLPISPTFSDFCDHDKDIRAELGCILTMFKMTKAPDSIKAIMAYITEITWDERLKSVPLLQVYQTLHESLMRTDRGIYPRHGARDRAFWSAKALLHLYNQRRYIYNQHPPTRHSNAILEFDIDHRRQQLGYKGRDKDYDLQSTFYIVDWTFGLKPEIPWPDLDLSDSHKCWLSHILQYRAFNALHTQKELTEDVRGFVVELLRCRNHPARAVANCLSIVRMVADHTQKQILTQEQRSVFFWQRLHRH